MIKLEWESSSSYERYYCPVSDCNYALTRPRGNRIRCPDCGSLDLALREAECSAMIKWFTCENGHKFSHKTGLGKSAEFSGCVIAIAVVTRLILDHGGGDVLDDMSSSF